jgi:hypothetical protein
VLHIGLAENVLTLSKANQIQQIQMGGKVTITVLTFCFLNSLNGWLFLRSYFLSNKWQLMTEQQGSHSSV